MVSYPKCNLCKASFRVNGPQPFLLPCLHAVCEPCMKSQARPVTCPNCSKHRVQQDTKLKVDKVRKAYVLHLTAKHHPSELLCSHEVDGNQAVSWCIDCQELFCEYCYNLHCGFKALKGHVFKSLEELAQGSQEELPRATHKHKDKVQDLKESCEKEIERNEINSSAFERSKELQKEHISQTFEMLRSLLDQREKEVKLEFESKEQEILTLMRTNSETLRKTDTLCEGILEYTRMDSTVCFAHDDTDISEAIEMTKQFSPLFSNLSANEPQSIKFVTQNLPGLRETIRGFAKICTFENEREVDKLVSQEDSNTRVLNQKTWTWKCPRCQYQNNSDTFTCSSCKRQGKDKAQLEITNAPMGVMATRKMTEKAKRFEFARASGNEKKKGFSFETPKQSKALFGQVQRQLPQNNILFSTPITSVPAKTSSSTPISAQSPQTMASAQTIFSTQSTGKQMRTGTSPATQAVPARACLSTPITAEAKSDSKILSAQSGFVFDKNSNISTFTFARKDAEHETASNKFANSKAEVSGSSGLTSSFRSVNNEAVKMMAKELFWEVIDEFVEKITEESTSREAWNCSGCSALNSPSVLLCHICLSRKE